MRKLLLSFCLVFAPGCYCTKSHVKDLQPLPQVPSLSSSIYGGPRIISAHTNSFEVSKDFVSDGVKTIDFTRKMKEWKEINKIP